MARSTARSRREASMRGRPVLAVIALALALGGCDRVLAIAVGARPVQPAALRQLSGAQIVDLRSRHDHAAGHLAGSLSVPWVELDGQLAWARARRGGAASDRPLVLVDETGRDALLAAPTARLHGHGQVYTLAGGVRRWRAEGGKLQPGPAPVAASLERIAHPVQELTRGQQLVAFLSGGVIKPTYMLLALLIVLALRRARAPALRVLRHGVLWFFVGEAFCAINFYFHRPGAVYFIDLLHGVGMVAMSALIPWGLYRLLDDRVLHFSDPAERCVVQRLCGRCWKRDPVRCGPHDLMLLLVVGLAVISLIPLSSDLRPAQVVSTVFGSSVDYGAPIINHLVELRAYPVLGALTLLLTFVLLWGEPRSVRRAEPFFFVGFGLMAYPLLRSLLVNTFRGELYWSDFWEELTELVLIVAVGALLLVFRRQLGLQREAGAASADPGKDGEGAPPGGAA
jgi:rhodanese-related sulfurtransferase